MECRSHIFVTFPSGHSKRDRPRMDADLPLTASYLVWQNGTYLLPADFYGAAPRAWRPLFVYDSKRPPSLGNRLTPCPCEISPFFGWGRGSAPRQSRSRFRPALKSWEAFQSCHVVCWRGPNLRPRKRHPSLREHAGVLAARGRTTPHHANDQVPADNEPGLDL